MAIRAFDTPFDTSWNCRVVQRQWRATSDSMEPGRQVESFSLDALHGRFGNDAQANGDGIRCKSAYC